MGCNKVLEKESSNKSWFSKECRTAMKHFHLAKKSHNKCKSWEKSQSKNFKRVMDEYIKTTGKVSPKELRMCVLQRVLENFEFNM